MKVGSGMSRVLSLVAAAAVLGSCSGTDLSDLGNRSAEWIDEPLPSMPATTAPPVEAALATVPLADINWHTDDLGIPESDDPALMLSVIINRSPLGDRFLPASRFEIAALLPDLMFPSTVPLQVTDITSQIIRPPGVEFDPGQVAAFGLWAGEPYGSSRTVGQVGVLDVDLLQDGTAPPNCGDAADCTSTVAGPYLVAATVDGTGTTWVWDAGSFRYRLFLRSVSGAVAVSMIEGSEPLARAFQAVGSPTTDGG